MPLSDIVNVSISADVKSVPQASFGTMLLLGTNLNLSDRVEYYSDAATALAKVIGTGTLEEAQINAYFAQFPAPAQIALGSIQTSKTMTFAGTFTAGTISASVDNTVYTQPLGATTMDGALSLLAAEITVDTVNVSTAVYSAGPKTLVVTPKTGKSVSLSIDTSKATGTISGVLTCTALAETYAQAAAACALASSGWYALSASTRDLTTQKALADWTEVNLKDYCAASADTNIINQSSTADSTSIAWYVRSKGYVRTAVITTTKAATEGPDAALFGQILPLTPGTYTAMFKTLTGVTADTLTTTQANNALSSLTDTVAKNANTYENLGGKSIVRNGTTGSGEFMDIVIFIDYLTAALTSSVFAAMSSQNRVPFTPAGLLTIQNAITGPLKAAQDSGAISPNVFAPNGAQIGGFYITMPSFASISTNDKKARQLKNVAFTAFLSGAIHAVQINGVVTV